MNDIPTNNNTEPHDAFAAQLNQKSDPKPRKKKTWLYAFGTLVLVAVIGAGLYLTQTKYGRDFTQAVGTSGPAVMKVVQNPNLLFDNVNSDIVNILLIGRDVNYKIIYKNGKPIAHTYDEDTPARSDTMILLSLNRRQHTLRMISFPRDALVHMPPNDYDVRVAKLNAAHAYGGPDMLKQVLHDDLGITVHRHAVVRFEGFKSIIDEIGGIEVDVIGALHRDGTRGDLNYDDNWGNLHIHLKPGMQHLDGTQAHNYVRFRMDLEGDPGRIRRQQQVMRALGKKLTQQPIYKIPGLVQEVRRQFSTDMTDEEIASAAYFARSMDNAGHISPVTLFGIYARTGSIILNRSKNIKLLSFLLGHTFNPSVFLENSPSTERDELGSENDSSPDAQELLQAAGILEPKEADTSENQNSSSRTLEDESSANHEESANLPSSTSRLAEAPATRRIEIPKRAPRNRPKRVRASERDERAVDNSEDSSEQNAPVRQAVPDPIRHHETPIALSVDSPSPIPQPE